MDDPVTPFSLAIAAVEAAFELVTRHTTSTDSAVVLEVNRLIRNLQPGNTQTLTRAIRSLGTLGWDAEFAGFRASLDHLRYSLPAICAPQATGMELSSAADALKQLEGAATTLRAPDISSRVAHIIKGVQTLASPRCMPPSPGH